MRPQPAVRMTHTSWLGANWNLGPFHIYIFTDVLPHYSPPIKPTIDNIHLPTHKITAPTCQMDHRARQILRFPPSTCRHPIKNYLLFFAILSYPPQLRLNISRRNGINIYSL